MVIAGDLMKEAGLTHGGFYAHFASRDALWVEAMRQIGSLLGVAITVARLLCLRGYFAYPSIPNLGLLNSECVPERADGLVTLSGQGVCGAS